MFFIVFQWFWHDQRSNVNFWSNRIFTQLKMTFIKTSIHIHRFHTMSSLTSNHIIHTLNCFAVILSTLLRKRWVIANLCPLCWKIQCFVFFVVVRSLNVFYVALKTVLNSHLSNNAHASECFFVYWMDMNLHTNKSTSIG